MTIYAQLINDCDAELRAGRTPLVLKRLAKLNCSRVPRQLRLPLANLRRRAIESSDWDALRSADVYALKLKFHKGLFKHLLFGSPFPTFRERLCRDLGQDPTETIYVLGPKNSPRLDLRTGLIDEEAGLKPGRKCHQLLDVLLRDFYRPLRIGGIFSELFPGERFDVATSPDRVHQLIRRTRRWIEQSEVPVAIQERAGFYSLAIKGEFSFRVPLERDSVDSMGILFRKLSESFNAGSPFSAVGARENLDVSRRTIQRLLNWGIEAGRIERVGSASPRYAILTPHASPLKTKRAA